MRKTAAILALAVLAACTSSSQSKQTASDLNSPAAPSASATGDAGFILKALTAGTRQYKRATLEVESKDTYIRSYANKIVTDQGTTNQELMSLARAHAVTVPGGVQPPAEASGSPAPQAHGAVEAEKALSMHPLTPAAYLQTEIDGNVESIALYKAAVQSSANTDVRDFARKNLPILQQHLDMARKYSSIEKSLPRH